LKKGTDVSTANSAGFENMNRRLSWTILTTMCCAALGAGCAGTSIQYPPFPNQTKRVENPADARVYLIRPSGAMNNRAKFVFYGTGPAATGPRVDPQEWQPAVPLLGIFPENPTPDSPWRIVGEVASGTYICWEEPPRTFVLQNAGPINLIAGNVYYLRIRTPAFSLARIDVINEEEARTLLKNCRPPNDYGGRN
jgi:hypothetical protein